jgi:hypothetical protein
MARTAQLLRTVFHLLGKSQTISCETQPLKARGHIFPCRLTNRRPAGVISFRRTLLSFVNSGLSAYRLKAGNGDLYISTAGPDTLREAKA